MAGALQAGVRAGGGRIGGVGLGGDRGRNFRIYFLLNRRLKIICKPSVSQNKPNIRYFGGGEPTPGRLRQFAWTPVRRGGLATHLECVFGSRREQ